MLDGFLAKISSSPEIAFLTRRVTDLSDKIKKLFWADCRLSVDNLKEGKDGIKNLQHTDAQARTVSIDRTRKSRDVCLRRDGV